MSPEFGADAIRKIEIHVKILDKQKIMIDDIKKVTELIERMKSVLPIPAYPTKRVCFSLKNNHKLKPKHLIKIADVMYMGNEGGIGCAISIENDEELMIVSLTHLRIKETHPLSKEIKKYQIKRIRSLASMAGK